MLYACLSNSVHTGESATIKRLMTIDDCILGEKAMFNLNFLSSHNGAGAFVLSYELMCTSVQLGEIYSCTVIRITQALSRETSV